MNIFYKYHTLQCKIFFIRVAKFIFKGVLQLIIPFVNPLFRKFMNNFVLHRHLLYKFVLESFSLLIFSSNKYV